MAGIEDIEMDRKREALDKDLLDLVDKYVRIMEWDVPDADEPKARRLVLDEMKRAIGRIQESQ